LYGSGDPGSLAVKLYSRDEAGTNECQNNKDNAGCQSWSILRRRKDLVLDSRPDIVDRLKMLRVCHYGSRSSREQLTETWVWRTLPTLIVVQHHSYQMR
jgi:hypothetical protein